MLSCVITPVISASIGYITNKLAIKMMFRPKKNYFGIQGLIIKRKVDLAKAISELFFEKLLASKIDATQTDLIGNMAGMMARNLTQALAKDLAIPEDSDAFLEIYKHLLSELKKLCDGNMADKDLAASLQKSLTSAIIAIPDSEIESLINNISAKEFRAIEIIGAALGFIIGLVNVLLV